MFTKVPEATVYFWIIKVPCTTVGETAADYLNTTLYLGLTVTTCVMTVLLVVALIFQFRARRYVPGLYWLAVVLISIVGTLVTDNLTDGLGVSLAVSTMAFAAALAVTFGIWFASERTLSIHTIYTVRRETFYWSVILFTFALGTAAGDLVAERLNIGYLPSLGLFAAAITAVTIARFPCRLDAVSAFWLAYILTRPLGASLGDYLSQPTGNGGLGLGTVGTSGIFLVTILGFIAFLTVTRRGTTPAVAGGATGAPEHESGRFHGSYKNG